jgi:hypothetical protein
MASCRSSSLFATTNIALPWQAALFACRSSCTVFKSTFTAPMVNFSNSRHGAGELPPSRGRSELYQAAFALPQHPTPELRRNLFLTSILKCYQYSTSLCPNYFSLSPKLASVHALWVRRFASMAATNATHFAPKFSASLLSGLRFVPKRKSAWVFRARACV